MELAKFELMSYEMEKVAHVCIFHNVSIHNYKKNEKLDFFHLEMTEKQLSDLLYYIWKCNWKMEEIVNRLQLAGNEHFGW